MTIKQIFDEIAAEPSTNKKIELLQSHKENILLQRVLHLADSPRVKFYIKQIPAYTSTVPYIDLATAINMLDELSSRRLTGHAAVNHLTKILSSLNHDDANIIERIIEKDCKCGIGTTLINKVFDNLIEETPYMGCKAYSKDLVNKLLNKGPVISQIKMDGRYANIIISEGSVEVISRQGEPTILDGAEFIRELSTFDNSEYCVLNGELTMDNMHRYESNGIIASLISIGKKKLNGEDVSSEIKEFEDEHMPYEEALSKIRFTAWDKLSLSEYTNGASNIIYIQRLQHLQKILNGYKLKMVSLIDYRILTTYEEVMGHFKEALNQSLEGTVIKAKDGKWKDGKPTWQVKLKKEINLDLKIVGFNLGTGKNSKVISSIDVESADGLLRTSPTGMKEKIMKFVTDNQSNLLGKVLEIKCSGISQNSSGEYSVLHPVYKEIRDDKSTANTLTECIEIDEAAMN